MHHLAPGRDERLPACPRARSGSVLPSLCPDEDGARKVRKVRKCWKQRRERVRAADGSRSLYHVTGAFTGCPARAAVGPTTLRPGSSRFALAALALGSSCRTLRQGQTLRLAARPAIGSKARHGGMVRMAWHGRRAPRTGDRRPAKTRVGLASTPGAQGAQGARGADV